ncbi:uncharacterized protein LOC143298049 isoform X2 [Babylonia areolata]|uniref:uncharacterized protein LOC143298049 isoform X2 n=1 Tax=Babylonia areolata TaxID=304850 RepID=UPI003FD4F03D
MSDKESTLSSLQAIRAKLQQLQMQQHQAPTEHRKHKEQNNEASHTNSFSTPSSTEHSETGLLSYQNTATRSLHLPEREQLLSNPEPAQLKGFSVKQPSKSQWQGIHRASDTASGLSQGQMSGRSGASTLLNTSTNRTADLTDRSLSSSLHVADYVSSSGLGKEANHRKVVGLSSKTANQERPPCERVPVHSGKFSEGSHSAAHIGPEQKPQLSQLMGRSNNQNTDEFEFKVPKHASGYTDSQMELGPSTGNLSTDDMSVTDLPSFTHPSSASKQHSMRHTNSTPDMRSSASKFSSSQLKLRSLGNLGMPMRVRKHQQQQHPVALLSEEKEDDSDLINSFKPLNPSSHIATGRFASLASSGYHSDMTITTENSIPDQPAISANKNLSLTAGSEVAELKAVSKPVESKNHAPLSSHLPSSVSTARPLQGVPPVMSTPSCKGPQIQPAVLHTPSGEAIDTVTVNGEQYCVLKKVGRGGSAQVYMVLDANKNIRALKVVDLEGAGPEVVDGFRNEIRLLQRLQYCDSVIKMFNFELNKKLNCLYVVLEFGETDLSGFFSTRAKQGQGLDPTLIKFYWREMLRAVNALHKEGVIHSDLKPANFMLVAGNLKLIDFGIANTLQQDKTSVLKESRVGTPSYMSPEAIMAACDDGADDSMEEKENESQAQPKYKVGVRSDVWSLGCILYNMVYGRTPFQHIKNNMAKLQAITNPAVPIKFPDLPDPHVMDVLKKCLRREVKSRATTAELLAHPYLTNGDKQSEECHTPPAKVARRPPPAQGSTPLESRRLQELLRSQLAQGSSPGTASAVSRVVGMLQKLESGKH